MKIDHTNYMLYLKQSSEGRAGTPDGNVFFDTVNNRIELIGADELPTFDHTGMGGGATDANQLTNVDGITLRAIYKFEDQERAVDEVLRQYLRGTTGVYKFAGAYDFLNGVKLSEAVLGDGSTDRNKIRDSGWREFAASGGGHSNVDRIYYGVRSTVDGISIGTTPYYTLVDDTTEVTMQAATINEFSKPGYINEAIQVYGDTTYGDTTAGDFDHTSKTLVLRARTWGAHADEEIASLALIDEFSGSSEQYTIKDRNDVDNVYNIADVYGAGQIAPWTGMSLEKLVTPQTETGFNEADGDFTWVLHNTLGGSLTECLAFLDALSMQATDIDSGAGTYIGLNGRVWYIHNEQTGLATTVAIDGEGLFIENLPLTDLTSVVLTDDAGDAKTYPFYPELRIFVGTAAKGDTNAWYHVFYVDGADAQDYGTASAVTVNDKDGNPIKGLCNVDADADGYLTFAYDYDNNTQAGLTAATDKQMVIEVESHGANSIKPTIKYFTVTRDVSIAVDCEAILDPNA